jgi:hypothetical protein
MHICALQTFDPIRADPYPRSNRIEAILEKARSDRDRSDPIRSDPSRIGSIANPVWKVLTGTWKRIS